MENFCAFPQKFCGKSRHFAGFSAPPEKAVHGILGLFLIFPEKSTSFSIAIQDVPYLFFALFFGAYGLFHSFHSPYYYFFYPIGNSCLSFAFFVKTALKKHFKRFKTDQTAL